ncbi:lipase maturation factor 2-like [Cimex lectularius]|uniref:Lipase maturation factor n=1 Tax=Cimex lectularius TaxID=79782 RepID=A0A8I6TES1_CIMLE|nr:lipase maturation factor 2-like [Cimex lectularius]
MAEIKYTRNLFLRCVNVIYLFAFASLYVQIPGLYGKNGILPARAQLDLKPGLFDEDYAKQIQKKPTLLWFSPYFGVDTEYMMDILALTGMFLAFTGFISQKFCIKPVFSALWSLYYSLYQVGQTFMWFQWDILLLETGFLCIILAPWHNKTQRANKKQQASAPSDLVRFWLVRWLLFRLMFSSGIVKLTSGCPTWWGLTALSVHFESMCIPSPLAWYSHHLPSWFLKLNTVFANFVEIVVPPLFFFPVRYVRIVAFFVQVFLQFFIILTGNFNFFNYLTITLCLSLLDDDFFYRNPKNTQSFVSRAFKLLTTVGVYGGVTYATCVLYKVKMLPSGVIDCKLNFTPADFENALVRFFPVIICTALASLLYTAFKALGLVFSQTTTKIGRLTSLFSTVFYIFVALFLFTDSMVPFSTLHPAGNMSFVPKETKELHNKISHLHLTNAYGLFRRMTGVGGRPEVIIEGSYSMEGPWMEYNFKYKPGNVNDSLPFVAPHQPRLDWQMWFAALGTYHQNPWIMSLAYRLLTGQQEVLNLLDNTRNPFSSAPPKYVRAFLYHYHYTPWSQRDKPATWTRKKVSEYFPIFSKDHTPLLDYLKNYKILEPPRKETLSPTVVKVLNEVRNTITVIEPPFLMLSLVLTGLAIIVFSSIPPSAHHPATKQSSQSKGKNKSK